MRVSFKDYVWNMLGSLVYALASLILSTFIIKIVGESVGGVFNFAYSTVGQHAFIIAYFGMRSFQITDIKRVYSFEDYKMSRIITTIASLIFVFILAIICIIFRNYAFEYTSFFICVCLLKVIDGYADVYESEFQRDGKLYISGQSLFFRTVVVTVVLLVITELTFNYYQASMVAVGCAVILVYLLDVRRYRLVSKSFVTTKQRDYKKTENIKEQTKNLLLENKFLFITAFVDFVIFSATKYALLFIKGEELSSLYGILFMPASMIYVVCYFFIKPNLTPLADAYKFNKKFEFRSIIKKMYLICLAISIPIILATYFFGHTILDYAGKFVFSYSVADYQTELFNLVVGGVLYTFANIAYYVLVVLRKQKQIFTIYIINAIVAIILGIVFSYLGSLYYASIGYALTMLVLALSINIYTFYERIL